MSETQEAPTLDVSERTKKMGEREAQSMDRRLFMQLLVFDCKKKLRPVDAVANLSAGLQQKGCAAVLYSDLNNPNGIGLLSWSEDPSFFATKLRDVFTVDGLSGLQLQPEFTMLGRTYASGYEPDLQYWLFDRPMQTASNPKWPWAIWYPLRRSGEFERLPPTDKGAILREHGEIGKAYGAADLAHDIRLACHGLDAKDNEFVIGLIGKDLHPLSHVVQAMRHTRQTSEYIAQMGPFFVGHVVWRSNP